MSVLDLPRGTGLVGSQIRWLALTPQLEVIGEVHPETPTSITNNTSSNIIRSLRGLTLRQNDVVNFNLNTVRFKPVWEFEDGSREDCGVFQFTGNVRERGSLHTLHQATLMDGNYQLDQEMSESFGLRSRSLIYPALEQVMNAAGITHYEIDPTDERIKDPVNWPIGTTWLKVLRDLCRLCGFYRPWFSNSGVGQLRAPTELTEEGAHVYDFDTDAGRIEVGTIRENDQLLDAPNVYVVVSNGATQVEIKAKSYVDARLPYSVENIGYERPKVIRLQGLADVNHAKRISDAYASTDSKQFYVVEFAGPPDPRHDTFQPVKYDGSLWRELRWTMDLQPGGRHTHFCTKGPYDQEGT